MNDWVLGCDPGKTGALAQVGPGEALVIDMPENVADLADWMEKYNSPCYIEKQQAMPKQGVSSTFTTGFGYGQLIGILAALRIPYHEVSPAVWKRAMGLQGKDKSASRALARSLFPTAELHRVKDHGRAEALLIAEYGRRLEGKGQ